MANLLGQLHQCIARQLPGEHRDYYIGDDQGPVATVTEDGAHHISYVVVCYDEQGQIRGLDVRYQESYEDPYRAGVEFAELKEYAPVPADAPGADPANRRDLLEMKISHQQSHQRWLVEDADEDLRIILGEDR